jgi:hypothetical protein
MVDMRNRKIRSKFECILFTLMIDKEQQRIKDENVLIAKLSLKIDDKLLIKHLQKVCKKLLRPFKGL